MRLSTILFGTSNVFGTGSRRNGRTGESRLWTRAGLEPSTTELLADPIAILLMQADKLQASEVESLLRHARQRAARARQRRDGWDDLPRAGRGRPSAAAAGTGARAGRFDA